MSIVAKKNKLAQLNNTYQQALPKKIAQLCSDWEQVKSEVQCEERLSTFKSHLHIIAGSAGTFGFPSMSKLACDIERMIADCSRGAEISQTSKIDRHINNLKDLADSGPEHDLSLSQLNPKGLPESSSNCIFVIEDDPLQAEEIETQLSAFGWQVKTFASSSLALEALHTERPAVLIVDVVLPEGSLGGTDLLNFINLEHEPKIPSVVISSRWDWEARLAASKAGASAYLCKPLDYSVLTDTLDALTSHEDKSLYRVMIIEDSQVLAESYAQILRHAGMSVEVVIDVEKILQKMQEFRPELILMDLYMPACSGIEVTRVIRQDPKYLSVPVVYLSTESGRKLQLAAMEIGADDFLTKPITAEQLLMAVSFRCQRFRSLASLIHQDSLTGLLNHSAFKSECEIEISRALRSSTTAIVVMLDIDNFKNVNDSYGHPMGDKVIIALAKLLKARLRKVDAVGRYGGEEFAIIMPETTMDAALSVLNELRESFSKICFSTAGQTFNCTFSAGMANAPAYKTTGELLRVADERLYLAKQAGRNRVACSDSIKQYLT